ncbi:MAG: hypothetical protein ACOYKJ_02625 [Candidatus Howiella sp.]|jgi:hypothetical protein
MDDKKIAVTETPAELQEVIQRILDTDAEAKKITMEANTLREQTERSLAKKKAEMREHYLKKAQRRIEQMKKEEAVFAEDAISAATVAHKAQLDLLERQYAANKDGWTNEIFQWVISR